jgi:hypothetical protein
LLVSRGQSRRLFRLLLIISPIIVASFAIGLPFGIQGVALSGSLVALIILPSALKYTFRGTQLNLRRVGRAVLIPVSLCLVGVFCAEVALLVIVPTGMLSDLLVAALGFAVAYSLSPLIPSVKSEMLCIRRLLRELQLSGRTFAPAAQSE